jgi:hypothetical protein
VDDRGRVILSVIIGAAVGGVFGFIAFTDAGRRFRQQLEPQLDSLVEDTERLRHTFERVGNAAIDTWQSVSHIVTAIAEQRAGGGDRDDRDASQTAH